MKNIQKLLLLVVSMWLVALPAGAAWDLNMMEGVTPMSHQIFGLHMFAIWVCVGIGLVVYGVMIYSIIFHRKSRGAEAANFHGNTLLEIFWSIIPLILLVILAIPATQVLGRMEDTKNADITIKITGYQWKWRYEYLDQNIDFFSNLSTPVNQIYGDKPKDEWYLLEVDKPLVLPVHKKIRFLVTSNDVIHAWWVPDLGVKRDAIPGFIHEAWANIEKPGIYRGQCAELCGVNHGFMPIVVKAVTNDEFEKWLAEQRLVASVSENMPIEHEHKPSVSIMDKELRAWIDGDSSEKPVMEEPKGMTLQELMTNGEEEYGRYCMACHQKNGEGMPPLFPALKGSSVAVGKSIARHINLVLTGVPGTAMQSYAVQLTDQEIAEIVTYERNAWGNNTGDVVQPSDVAAVRNNSSLAKHIHKKN